MNHDAPEDHDVATLVIFWAHVGRPSWAASDAVFLARLRRCAVADAQAMIDVQDTAGSTLTLAKAVMPTLPIGASLDWSRVISLITGWDEAHATIALQVAVQKGYLAGGPPQVSA